MPFKDPEFLENINKYGPGTTENAADLEELTATAAGRTPRSREEMMSQNFEAIAGRRPAIKKNQELIQQVRELGDQYKREARGITGGSSGIGSKMLAALGLKHGGKVSTASPNKKQKRW